MRKLFLAIILASWLVAVKRRADDEELKILARRY